MFAMLIVGQMVSAQDIIVLKSGDLIQSKVLEVGENDLKYKKWDNIDGPTYTMSLAKILSVNYQNGKKDIFTDFTPVKSDVAKSVDNVSQSITMSGNNISKGIDNSVYLKQQQMINAGETLQTIGTILLFGCIGGGIALGAITGSVWIGGVGVLVGIAASGIFGAIGSNKIEAANSIQS